MAEQAKTAQRKTATVKLLCAACGAERVPVMVVGRSRRMEWRHKADLSPVCESQKDGNHENNL